MYYQHLLQITLDKVYKKMYTGQISPEYEYLTISIEEFPDFETFLTI
jgi:hypothetical protein